MKANCFNCQHFRVTWDQHNPRGCSAYQFKSKQVPSLVVKQSSGLECMKFKQKQMQGVKR
ncbi:uracil-DNA glycosylase [Ureibacillus composti]